MPLFRKKPVVIEAREFKVADIDSLCIWCGGEPINPGAYLPGINIKTLEGNMLATEGDFIIKGIKGEFYPCKPDVFMNTYEALP